MTNSKISKRALRNMVSAVCEDGLKLATWQALRKFDEDKIHWLVARVGGVQYKGGGQFENYWRGGRWWIVVPWAQYEFAPKEIKMGLILFELLCLLLAVENSVVTESEQYNALLTKVLLYQDHWRPKDQCWCD